MQLNLSQVLIITFFISAYSTPQSEDTWGDKKIIQSVFEADSSIIDTSIEISAREIIDNYIIAIGGKDNLYSISDRTTVMSGSVQGFDISLNMYQKAPDKRKQITKVGGNEQLLIYNGERGFAKTGNKEEEITGLELEKLKYESTITLLTDLEHYGITLNLEGIEVVDSIEAYKIIMTLPSGIKWTQYYNTENHFKVKESKYIKTPGGLFEQVIWYYDYQEVEGIKYPFKIKQRLGNQSMDFIVISIKVNSGLADREFEIE
jgi:hypothetical protein